MAADSKEEIAAYYDSYWASCRDKKIIDMIFASKCEIHWYLASRGVNSSNSKRIPNYPNLNSFTKTTIRI